MLVAGLLVALQVGKCEDIEGFERRFTSGPGDIREYCGNANLSQAYRGSNYCLVSEEHFCCGTFTGNPQNDGGLTGCYAEDSKDDCLASNFRWCHHCQIICVCYY